MTMSRRPGNRWDDQNRDRDRHRPRDRYNDYHRPRRPPPPQQQQPKEVSDEQAMKALLFSAESRQRERDGEYKKHSRSDRDRNRGRSRWGDNKDNNSSNQISYYGPGGSSGGGRDNEDRKRKRFSSDRDRENSSRRRRDNGRENDTRNVIEDDRKPKKEEEKEEEEKPPPEFKPNFGLSGALAKDTETGNVYKGVVLKFKEPPEARAPNTQWRFYVFKPKPGNSKKSKEDDNDLVETLHVSKQSAYLMGRNGDICDIPLLHPSLSSQHAVLQYRAVPVPSDKIGAPPRLSCQPYIMDLESTNGTFLNGVRIDAARYYQLKRGDMLTFGASTREYVLLTENTTSVN